MYLHQDDHDDEEDNNHDHHDDYDDGNDYDQDHYCGGGNDHDDDMDTVHSVYHTSPSLTSVHLHKQIKRQIHKSTNTNLNKKEIYKFTNTNLDTKTNSPPTPTCQLRCRPLKAVKSWMQQCTHLLLQICKFSSDKVFVYMLYTFYIF